ncbi:MAG: FecR family protein [Marinifilaceae bacterium]
MEDLLLKYYHKELNSEEIQRVESWLKEDEENRKNYEMMVRIWEHAPGAAVFDSVPVKEDWDKVKLRIRSKGSSKGNGGTFNFFLKVAAGIALLISLGVAGYYSFFGNRQQIFMVDNLAEISKNQILLSDGTKVTLNVDSRLYYPEEFGRKNRTVKLEGEAYFEVHRNPEKPFIIQHGNTETRVLGTKFNLRAYPQETEVKVAVTEGKVKLSERKNTGKHVVLTKDKVGVYHRDTRTMTRLDQLDENFLSWRTGVLNFRNSSLSKVIKDLKRHYRVDFVVEDIEHVEKLKVSARFENQELEDVLNELSLFMGIKFTKKKNFVLVEK